MIISLMLKVEVPMKILSGVVIVFALAAFLVFASGGAEDAEGGEDPNGSKGAQVGSPASPPPIDLREYGELETATFALG